MTRPMPLEDTEWSADAEDLILDWAAKGYNFNADNLRRAMRPAPRPNMVGSVFRTAAGRGQITKVASNPSEVNSRRGGHQYMWTGTKPETRK